MRLVVLGSGTCVPSATRCSSGYWVEVAGEIRARLDCGAGTVHAMARYGLPWETLTHQLITHFHVDHVGELPALLFAFKHGRVGRRTAPLTIAGPHGLRALVERLRDALYPELLSQEFPLHIVELQPDAALELGGDATLRLCKTPHTPESVAMRIEAGGRSIGYTGDTGPSEAMVSFFRGVDVLIVECSFQDATARGTTRHMIADEVAALARDANVGHLIPTHSYFEPVAVRLTDSLARIYKGRITAARDGLDLTW